MRKQIYGLRLRMSCSITTYFLNKKLSRQRYAPWLANKRFTIRRILKLFMIIRVESLSVKRTFFLQKSRFNKHTMFSTNNICLVL